MGSGRALLILGHPGHEIYLKYWCRRHRPDVVFLTTGSRSGRTRDRIDFSRRLVAGWNCDVAPYPGQIEDRVLYEAVMAGDIAPLAGWLDQLVGQIESRRSNRVVVDAFQGYSVTHDLANLLARLAVMKVEAMQSRPIELLEFAPVPESLWPRPRPGCPDYAQALSPDEIRRKIAAAAGCADLSRELDWLLPRADGDFLASERLYALAKVARLRLPGTPYYEEVGRQKILEGVYKTVLRQDHFDACADRLLKHAGLNGTPKGAAARTVEYI